MSDAYARAVAFMRTLERARVDRVERTRFGEALFVPALPHVWYLNFLSVDGSVAATAEELAADAEDAQAPAGLRHRRVGIDDERLGSAVAPGFEALGWSTVPLLVMPRVADGRAAPPADVREVDRETLVPLWLEGMRAGGMGEEEARQVAAAKSVNERASRVQYFAAFLDGRPASYCELYSVDGVGQVEAVLTLPEHRGRGLASAVVLHAAAVSRRAGHMLTFLVAEENDWPKELYLKLGFEAAGRIWDFVLRPRDPTTVGGVP